MKRMDGSKTPRRGGREKEKGRRKIEVDCEANGYTDKG